MIILLGKPIAFVVRLGDVDALDLENDRLCAIVAVAAALLRFAEARPARAHPTDASPVLPALALWAVAPVRKGEGFWYADKSSRYP